MNKEILELVKKVQAIAQAGLEYANNEYDIERYLELRDISVEMMHKLTGYNIHKIRELFANESGYQTPKVDVRSVIFKGKKILMAKEKSDKLWSIPGGWADVGLTPFEVAVKEAREEVGLIVKPIRLLAVIDKKRHPHPPGIYHIYKLFILCKETGGKLGCGMETLEVKYFGINELPQLSERRITKSQILLMFEFMKNENIHAMCD